MHRPTVVFLHGLNTFHDDDLHLGPARFGRMDRYLRTELEMRGLNFLAVDGLGKGSPESQAQHASDFLRSHLAPDTRFHLLGNSLGGLTARAFAADPKWRANIRSIITWGTPHRGTPAANKAMRFTEHFPRLTQTLAQAGYDLRERLSTFQHYSPQAMVDFNLRFPPTAIPEFSFLCLVPLASVSPYFWMLYRELHGLSALEFSKRLINGDDTFAPSDGFISAGSQNWGERRGPFALDHFAQLGFTQLLLRPASRATAQLEFNRFCDEVSATVRSLDQMAGRPTVV